MGLLLQDLSFPVCNRLSAKLHKATPTDYFPAPVDQVLIDQVRHAIQQRYGPSMFLEGLTDRRLCQNCKMYLLEHTSSFKARVLEFEAEINLIAMSILPLIALSVSGSLYLWVRTDLEGVSLWLRIVPLVLVTLGLASMGLARLYPLRQAEHEGWLRMFMTATLFGATSGASTPPAERRPERGSDLGPGTA